MQRNIDTTNPCYNCPDRCADPNCHSACEKYLTYVHRHDADKEGRKAEGPMNKYNVDRRRRLMKKGYR